MKAFWPYGRFLISIISTLMSCSQCVHYVLALSNVLDICSKRTNERKWETANLIAAHLSRKIGIHASHIKLYLVINFNSSVYSKWLYNYTYLCKDELWEKGRQWLQYISNNSCMYNFRMSKYTISRNWVNDWQRRNNTTKSHVLGKLIVMIWGCIRLLQCIRTYEVYLRQMT